MHLKSYGEINPDYCASLWSFVLSSSSSRESTVSQNSVFCWDNHCDSAFKLLKSKLCSAPILTFPDTSLGAPMFLLDTDASDLAIGAVLSQPGIDGKERVIAYGSRSLSKSERNYCTTRKEMLALVYFTKFFRHYLLGRKFVVRTDHQSLKWLQNFKDAEGQVARWQEFLQEYDFECIHRPGKQHSNADALSRRPYRNHGDCPSCSSQHVTAVSLFPSDLTEWQHTQATDPETALLYEALQTGRGRPNSTEMQGKSYESRCLWSLWEQLKMDRGVMFVQHGPTYTARMVIPQSKVENVLTKLHEELGHAGINKMECAARSRFWWPHQHRDVVNLCNSCETCATMKNPPHRNRAPLQPMQAGYPNEIVGMDIIGPLPETSRHNRYILVMVDYFTKWCEAVALSQIDATTVARCITEQWICRWGAPGQLHSDRGTSFENSVIRELCDYLGIDKTRTTPYHPQGNGLVERTNRSLKSLLKVFSQNNPSSWDLALPRCLLAYRSTIHKSTGQTPSFLWTGRENRLPSDVLLPSPQPVRNVCTEYVSYLIPELCRAYQAARLHLERAQRCQKEYYDRKEFGRPLNVGDTVWMKNHSTISRLPSKLQVEWKGPYIVEKILSEATCVIRSMSATTSPSIVAHFNELKPYHDNIEEVPLVELELEVPPEGGVGRAPGASPIEGRAV